MPAGRPSKREWTEGAARAVDFLFDPTIQLDESPNALYGCYVDGRRGQHVDDIFDPLDRLSDATDIMLRLEFNIEYRANGHLRIYHRNGYIEENWHTRGKEHAFCFAVTKAAYLIGKKK